MEVDRYTKAVLTVIAVALAVLAGTQLFQLFEPGDAIARGGKRSVQKVTVCDETGGFCANVDETSRLFVK